MESPGQRTFRTVVGILLTIQSVGLAFIALFTLIIAPLIGGLAMIGGAGSASDEQVVKVWWMILLMTISPSIVTLILFIAAIKVLNRKHPGFVIIACVIFIALYSALTYIMSEELKKIEWSAVLPLIVPVLAIVVGVRMGEKWSRP